MLYLTPAGHWNVLPQGFPAITFSVRTSTRSRRESIFRSFFRQSELDVSCPTKRGAAGETPAYRGRDVRAPDEDHITCNLSSSYREQQNETECKPERADAARNGQASDAPSSAHGAIGICLPKNQHGPAFLLDSGQRAARDRSTAMRRSRYRLCFSILHSSFLILNSELRL